MITFKLVAESRCDQCGEWKATDSVAADAMKPLQFREETLLRLTERGWTIREPFKIVCPGCSTAMQNETECRHRAGDCRSIMPGLTQCQCGQFFVFLGGPGRAGQYKKIQDVTIEDTEHFDPAMERDFMEFCKQQSASTQ
jgi:hypothetical protein